MNRSVEILNWNECLNKNVATLGCTWIVLQNVINFLFGFASILAIFLVVWAGIRFVMSEGDKEKIINARKTLTYALIGLTFIGLSFVLFNFITQFTGSQGFFKEVVK